MSDGDGWGLVGMAVQSSSGRQEMEEGVRAIVSRWGLETGQTGGRDRGERPYFCFSHLLKMDLHSWLDTSSPRRAHLDPSSHLLPPHSWRIPTCSH